MLIILCFYGGMAAVFIRFSEAAETMRGTLQSLMHGQYTARHMATFSAREASTATKFWPVLIFHLSKGLGN